MRTSKIILFGASGQQGNAIAQKLMSEGHEVIAPVRSQKSKEVLDQQGIDARLSDFSITSLTTIVGKGEKVVMQVPVVITPLEMIAFAENALRAIVAAGSPHTVFNISSIVPKQLVGLQGPDARLTLKNLASELLPNAIVLSSTLYLENFSLAYRQAIEQGGVIPQAIPNDIPVAYLSFDDLAGYILAALKKTELKGRFIPIGGSEALTGLQLSEKLSRILGKHIHYQAISPEELAGFLTPMIGEVNALQVAEMYKWESTSGSSLLCPDVNLAKDLLQVSLLSFDAWAKKAFQI